MQAKWSRLMKAGGCLKRLWMPNTQKGATDNIPFEIWLTLREYFLQVLKGIFTII